MNDFLTSYETSKLAKEKGFDLKGYHNGGWGEYGEATSTPELGFIDKENRVNDPNKAICASTQSELQKWLRDQHYIYTYVIFNVFCGELTCFPTIITFKKEYNNLDYFSYVDFYIGMELLLQTALNLIPTKIEVQ